MVDERVVFEGNCYGKRGFNILGKFFHGLSKALHFLHNEITPWSSQSERKKLKVGLKGDILIYL
jgi:hypothetical protein